MAFNSEKRRPAASKLAVVVSPSMILFWAFFVAWAASAVFTHHKLQALEFRPDSAYYMQFAAKLLDERLTQSQSFVVRGDNFLGFVGFDGEDSLHQAIHLEPIKYLEGLIYGMSGILGIIIWRSFFTFLPLIYIALVARNTSRKQARFLLVPTAIYSLYPSAFHTVAYDFRPYALLAPAVFLLFLAIHFNRPAREVFLWFNVLLLIREEALVFSIIAILYLATRKYGEGGGRNRMVPALSANWLVWLVLSLFYYQWTGYVNERNWLLWIVISTIFFGVVCPVLFANHRLTTFASRYRELIIILALNCPVGYYFARRFFRGKATLLDLLFSPWWYIYVPGMLLATIWLWEACGESRKRKCLTGFAGLAVLACLVLNVAAPGSALASFVSYQKMIDEAKIVFRIRDRTDPFSAAVICDFWTCQAFADYENIFHLGSLTGERGFKKQFEDDELKHHLERDIEIVALRNESESLLQSMLESSTALVAVSLLEQNEAFSIYGLERLGMHQLDVVFREPVAMTTGDR